MILRFPFVGRNILNRLDNQNLEKSKETSKFLHVFLENDRLLWIRKLRKYNQNHKDFKDEWNSSIEKISVENIKQLVNVLDEFYHSRSTRPHYQHSPLHIIAFQGNLKLFEYIFRQNGLNNPKRSDGLTPLYFSSEKGHLRICSFIIEKVKDRNTSHKILHPLNISDKIG